MSMTYTKAQFAEKHKEAISLFQAGLGYRAVATALLLNPYTVRDWARFKFGPMLLGRLKTGRRPLQCVPRVHP